MVSNTKVVKQEMISSEYDILNLNIIDWNRLNGSWSGVGDAVATISSWFVEKATYTIVEHDLRKAPVDSHWPGWEHVGNHEPLGRLFWNDFYYRQSGILTFSDAPDFYGEFSNGKRFWGDIGRVSAQAFAGVQKKMGAHELWISVLNETQQVLIETMIDIQALYIYQMFGDEETLQQAENEARECPYCHQDHFLFWKDATQLTMF